MNDLIGFLYRNWNLDSDRGYGYLTWRGAVEDHEVQVSKDPTKYGI
jgi:hypothetical protein